MTLAKYNQQYEDILHANLSRENKNRLLAELMTELEKQYRIPMIRNKAWEQENKSIIALYRKISLSRNF